MMRTVRFNNISKLSLLAISLSALFASCNNEIEDEADPLSKRDGKDVMTFSAYTGGATRATDATADVVKTSGFNVAAWYDGKLYFKSGESASYTEDIANDKIFDTKGDTYYWPILSATNKIGFRAFNIIDGAAWNTEYESVKFSVASTAATQKDLVVAYAEATSKPEGGIQPLNFNHALSKINFSFVGDENLIYTINKIEVIAAGKPKDSNTTPVLNFPSTPAGSLSWDITEITTVDKSKPLVKRYDETDKGAAQGVTYTYDKQKDSDASAEIVVDGNTDTELSYNFMLLPQTGKVAIRVYYKIEEGGVLKGNCGYYETDGSGNHNVMLDADGKVVSTGGTNRYTSGGIKGCKTLIVDLGTDAPVWEAGKSYRYTLKLPTDNFLGDKDDDGVPDMVDDTTDPSNIVDLDGDGDKHDSEFGMDDGEWIEFSVSVASWGNPIEKDGNLVIK